MAKTYLLKAAELSVEEIQKRNIRPFKTSVLFSLDGVKQSSKGNRQAQYGLLEFYKFSSKNSSPEGLLTLGQIYYYGNADIEPEFEQARHYFELSLEKGHLGACGFLGQMYYRGEGVQKDQIKAFQYFRRGLAANGIGAGIAYNGMGLCYMNGIEVTEDRSEALEYFLKAIQNGSVEAMYNSALVMLKDESKAYNDIAIELLMNAAKQGYLLANYELAKIHSKNYRLQNLCLYLLRSFFEKYEISDLLDNSVSYFNRGLTNQALARFLLLSYQGFEVAQFNTAFVYSKNMKHNPYYAKRAAMWFYRSAQGGDRQARIRLGDIFYYGIGLDKPYPAAAMASYLISMNEKNPEGAYNVGYLYEKGIGVPRDYIMANNYYTQAIRLKPEAYWPIRIVLFKVSMLRYFSRMTDLQIFLLILLLLVCSFAGSVWLILLGEGGHLLNLEWRIRNNRINRNDAQMPLATENSVQPEERRDINLDESASIDRNSRIPDVPEEFDNRMVQHSTDDDNLSEGDSAM
jgi:TPR repeat protein